MVVFYTDQLATLENEVDRPTRPRAPSPTLFQILRWRLRLRIRALLDAMAWSPTS